MNRRISLPRVSKLLSLAVLAALVLNACDAILPSTVIATQPPGFVQTLAYQTIQANSQFEQLYSTPTIPKATDTPLPTRTPLPTLTPLPSRTALPTLAPEQLNPTLETTKGDVILPDGTLVPCNAAEFLGDITVPDDMEVSPGERFTKIWLFKNVGGCTWTPKYHLVLIWGHAMGTTPPIPLNMTVKPGEKAEISVEMSAPYLPLCFQGNWMFEDDLGNRFGSGFMYKEFFWVSITVTIPGLGGFKGT